MKKQIIITILSILLFNSCSAKSKGTVVQSKPMTEREKALEAAKRLDALIARENEEIDLERLNDKEYIEIYSHNQTLNISVQQIKVYSKPFTKLDENIIYITQKGDELFVKRILFAKNYKRSSIEVLLPSNKIGYIPLSNNPYKEGQFSFKEEIEVNGNSVKILNLKRTYTFESFTNDSAKLQALPSFDSEVLSEILNDVRLDATAITSDYKWLYVTYENHQGWINTKYLCDGIGGPVLYTPEETICEELLWADYR